MYDESPSNEFVVTINMPVVQQKQDNLGGDYIANFSPGWYSVC